MKSESNLIRGPLSAMARQAGLMVLLLLSLAAARAGVLSGRFTPLLDGSIVNLTIEGTLDWAHWGLLTAADFNHKASIMPLIANAVVLGPNGAQDFNDGLNGFSWSDGTPQPMAEATVTGFSVAGSGGGFQVSVPADTSLRRLKIYVGVRLGQGNFVASLSDSSAPDFTSTALESTLASDGVYTLLYSADSPGQFLTVTLTPALLYDESGSVRLQAATLSTNIPPSVSITNPVNNTAYSPLSLVTIEADAADPDGSITTVEFFAGVVKLSESTAAPYSFTWTNPPVGSFALTARATDNEGATAVSAPIAITVLTNRPPSVSILSPTNESNVLQSDTTVITAQASDPDGTISKLELFDGAIKLAENTNASQLTFGWSGATAGIHKLTARATDNGGLAKTSAAITVFVFRPGGALALSVATPPNDVNLTAEGSTDWAHWGLLTALSFNHKSGVAQQIGNYSVIGNTPAYSYADNYNGYTWTDGTPVQSVTHTNTGVYVVGRNNGFQLQVVADATVRTLKLYVGTFAARGKLQAYMSDFSAPVLSDGSVSNSANGLGGVYTIQYQAASAGQSLVLKYTGLETYDSYGNVTLQAATLVSANTPPTASLVSPTNGAVFLGPTNIDLQASASDPDGTIAALEIFQGATKLGDATGNPPVFHWTNVPPGNYSLTVRATDNLGASFVSNPIQIAVINGGGTLTGHIATPPASVNLSQEGTFDWAHWGLRSPNSFNHKWPGPAQLTSDVGTGTTDQYDKNASSFSWTNGLPTGTMAATTTGIYRIGLNSSFQLVLPADQTFRQIKVYVGLYGAHGKLEASLSDLSAAPYADGSPMSVYGNVDAVYTINYAAASAGQQLTIRYTAVELFDPDYGNVTWQAATLATINPGPILTPVRNANGTAFSFVTQRSVSYAVQFSDSLEFPNWVTLTNVPGNGLNATIVDSDTTHGSRYYRLKLE